MVVEGRFGGDGLIVLDCRQRDGTFWGMYLGWSRDSRDNNRASSTLAAYRHDRARPQWTHGLARVRLSLVSEKGGGEPRGVSTEKAPETRQGRHLV